MKMRIILGLGLTVLLAHSDAWGANPRQKRASARPYSHAVGIKDSPAALAPVAPPQTAQATAPEVTAAPALGDNDPEDVRYAQAKARAKQDPEVKTLKVQADQAANEEAARRASVAYNQSLFRKMRQIDRSLKPRIDLVEAAILRRINE